NKEKYKKIWNIAITQPRRISAINLCNRVCKEIGSNVGVICGYHIRFDNTTSNKTKITYLTDGMLLREFMLNNYNNNNNNNYNNIKYDIIILDECHERTLFNDILFGLIKQIQNKHNQINSDNKLKVIAMSATLNVNKFSKFFN